MVATPRCNRWLGSRRVVCICRLGERPAVAAYRRQPDRGRSRRRAVAGRAQVAVAGRDVACATAGRARAGGQQPVINALEVYRSLPRYLATRAVGARVPGLLAGPLTPLRLVH